LRVLKLRYLAHVTNAGVRAIAPLGLLETLDLTSTRVNDHCDLSPFTALRRLVLAQTDVTGATLPSLPNLQWLDLDGTKAGDTFIKLLPYLTTLEEVRLSHTLVSDANFHVVQLPSSLRVLHVDMSKLTGQGFSQPAGLYVLHMSYCGTTDASLWSLASFPNLTKLDLTANTSLTSKGLCALWPLRSLATLNLSECPQITDVAPLGAMAALRNLDFSWCKNLRDARGLTAVKGLEGLDLSHTAVDNSGVPTWSELSNLRRLRLTRTSVDDAGLEGLERVRGLERLDLHRTRVTDAGMRTLSGITSLVSLDVSGTLITTVSPVSHVPSVFHWHVPTS
jgi:Leucine-rich repeat (LRR) protein